MMADFKSSVLTSDAVVLGAALLVSGLVFNWLLRILRPTLSVLVTIALIALALQYFLGVSPEALWYKIIHLPQLAQSFWKSVANSSLFS
ncbi:hypothetical protein [Altericista sp. CCNU0014]|uniref:hypothetical protein n=1 Tax=Altericista sp. CCNU0014 TaxID=3082949 RepID=UPI00384F3065